MITTRIQDLPTNSAGDRQIEPHQIDDNFSALEGALFSALDSIVQIGGVATPGTVTLTGTNLRVLGRSGITLDGTAPVQVVDLTVSLAALPAGKARVVILPTPQTINRSYTDVITGQQLTDVMPTTLGILAVIGAADAGVTLDGNGYPVCPAQAVPVATVTRTGGGATLDAVENPVMVLRGAVGNGDATLPADIAGLPARVTALEARPSGSGGGSGVVTPTVYASAALSQPQSIPGSTWTKVNLDRTTTMPGSKFVAPHDGVYLASASVVFLGSGGLYTNAAIWLNGKEAIKVGEDSLVGSALALTATGAIELRAGDVLELYAYAGSGCDVYGGAQDATALNVISHSGGSSAAGTDVSSWPVMIATMDQGTMNGYGGWTLNAATFGTVPLVKVLDTHGAFDDATHSYVVPEDGTYRIEMKLRLSDNTGSGRSYGIGVDKTNTDNAAFVWGVSAPMRNSLLNQRLMTLKQGDRLSLYAFCDTSVAVIAAEFTVDRIR